MFHDWDSLFLLLGTAAAGFIGLLFVVTTLTVGLEQANASRGQRLYMTPTVFHFAAVLAISAMGVAPDITPHVAGAIIGVFTAAGSVYAMGVSVQIRKLRTAPDPPHWSDVWYYGIVPVAIYAGLGVASGLAWTGSPYTPHILAVMLTILLLIGIRNAWDLITWLAPRGSKP